MEVIACAVNISTHFNSLLAIGLNSVSQMLVSSTNVKEVASV